MNRKDESFEVENNGHEWVPVKATDAARAAEMYANEFFDEGWSDYFKVRVRDSKGRITTHTITWRYELVIEVDR